MAEALKAGRAGVLYWFPPVAARRARKVLSVKKAIRRGLAAALASLLIASCNTAPGKDDGDRVTSVSGEDAVMNAIIEEARSTVDVFLERLRSPGRLDTAFQVKYPFPTDLGSEAGVEHIWLSDLSEEDGTWYGVVQNDPDYIRSMRYGMRVKFDIRKVSDWMIVSGGKIVGGKSIRYLIERIPEKERSEELRDILSMFD